MGPKKTKKKKEKKKTPETTENQISEEELERRNLIAEAKKLFALTKKEEETFNELQQQREKINYFWIIEKKNLEDKNAELRNKQRELEDLEEKHQIEIKIYKDRVKHLLHEHQIQITKEKTEAQIALKLIQDEHYDKEKQLYDDRQSLKLSLKETELSHENYISTLKQEQDKSITLMRLEYERYAKEIQSTYERKRKALRDTLELKRKEEILKIEEIKNAHISKLMESHEKAFSDIKNYYNDITHNNLDLIKSLKEEVADLRKKESQDEKLINEITQENKRMSEPLKRALNDVEELQKQLEVYKNEKEKLKKLKSSQLKIETEISSLLWEEEILQQRYSQIQNDYHELVENFENDIYQIQQKSGFKTLLLQKKLEVLNTQVETKSIELNEVLAHAKLDPIIVGEVKGKLNDLVDNKNQMIKDLELELNRIIKTHRDLIKKFTNKLNEYGILKEELGFIPKINDIIKPELAS